MEILTRDKVLAAVLCLVLECDIALHLAGVRRHLVKDLVREGVRGGGEGEEEKEVSQWQAVRHGGLVSHFKLAFQSSQVQSSGCLVLAGSSSESPCAGRWQ